jgi:hypothetical protein
MTLEEELDHLRTVSGAFEAYQAMASRWAGILANRRLPDEEMVSSMARHLLLVLRTYCLPSNWDPQGRAKEDFPITIARTIGDQLAHILAGRIPGNLDLVIKAHVKTRGTPGAGPVESRDKALASAYIQCAKNKLLTKPDPTPIKTVSDLFAVSTRQVRRWGNEAAVHPSMFFPDAADENERADRIEAAMREAAKRYAAAGRGLTRRTRPKKPRR